VTTRIHIEIDETITAEELGKLIAQLEYTTRYMLIGLRKAEDFDIAGSFD